MGTMHKHQELPSDQGLIVELPQVAKKPQFPLGASTKLRIQDTYPLVLDHDYADEMNDNEDMQVIRVSDLDEHYEGYGEFWGMTASPI